MKIPSKLSYLTKTNYVNGLSCTKWVWLKFNNPHALPEVDEALQHRFDEGHAVGELAKQLFSNGMDIKEIIPAENDKKSRELLKERKPLFEAGFIHRNRKCYARADILVPVPGGKWDILEVKSTTSVKDYHLEDISFQRYCYESAGLQIRKCFVVHVNNEYVRHGSIDPNEFFTKTDVTDAVEVLLPTVPSKVRSILKIIRQKQCPEFMHGEDYHKDDLGVHANDRFLKEHPELDIMELYGSGKRAIELFNSGILQIKDIPSDYELNAKQLIQKKAHLEKMHQINHTELQSFLKRLRYPLHFLDFESYSTAIPLYDGLRPYQAIPFQFSVHVVSSKGAKLIHRSFIAEGARDPRPAFIAELRKALGTKGSIVVYNQSFEQTVLKNLAIHLPKYAKWVDSVTSRMVDLLIPFRSFAYYHPSQHGHASLKSVLPALTGITYDDFEIANGSDASLSYLYITHGSYDGKKATPKEVKQIRGHLERYCGLDTEGMVHVLGKLEGLVVT